MTSDPYEYAMRRIAAAQPEFSWSPDCANDLEGWQTRVRAALSRASGLDKIALAEPEPEFGEEVDCDGYTRQALTFQSRPGWRVLAYVLRPTANATGAGVLCIPGHSEGIDTLVGVVEEDCQKQFALQAVRRGHTVLTIEQSSIGRHRSARNANEAWTCTMDSMLALSLGETMTAWRVADAQAGLSLLSGVDGVDAARLGVLGISGGGLTTLWTAAFDTRVKAALVSGYFCTAEQSIYIVDHCVDNYIPGLELILDTPEMAALIAQRGLFVESGISDPIFKIDGFRQAVYRAKEIYADLGLADNFGSEEFEGGHEFHGVGGFEFLGRKL